MTAPTSAPAPAGQPITSKADNGIAPNRARDDSLKTGDSVKDSKDHKDGDTIIKLERTTPEVPPERSPSKDATAPLEESQPDTPMPDATDKDTTPNPDPSPAENVGRVNRKTKRFVVTNKDPRALAKAKGKKREADGSVQTPTRWKGKRARAADEEELNLPYRSIKAINMPPRIGLVPGKVPPMPDRNNLPFGDTEDYYNSLILHWCDEHEVGYGTAAGLYNEMFPEDKITDEAVRRRHIRSLQRLAKKYGAKPADQIGPVGQKVLRRGKSRAPALSGIVAEVNRSADSAHADGPGDATTVTAATTAPDPPQPENALPHRLTAPHRTIQAKRKQKSKDFEKACIVVWKDSLKMDFKAIRDKLESEYKWSLGLGTVEKYYYQTLDRVHGTVRQHVEGDQDEEAEDGQEVAGAADGEVAEDVVAGKDEASGQGANSEQGDTSSTTLVDVEITPASST